MSVNVHEFGKMKGEPAAMLALAGGASYADAARAAGITVRTVARRMDDDRYRRCVTAARSEMIERASGQLAEGTTKAVQTLSRLLEGESEQVRLGAARAILDLAGRYRELVEISERVARLEELLEADEPKVRRIAS